MENIFDKENIAFHGLRDYDFTKLKSILGIGILPQSMVPEEKRNSNLGAKNAEQVFMTISPKVLGEYKSRAYNWYVKNSLGVVVDVILKNALENRSFPDSGSVVGPIPSELIIGITIPKEIYEANIGDLKKLRGTRVLVEDSFNSDDTLISDIVDRCNINKLPIYDSSTGQLLKEYTIKEENGKQR